jgi:mRNA deadenylase 3'-5' endonuclease subunit Ccr4
LFGIGKWVENHTQVSNGFSFSNSSLHDPETIPILTFLGMKVSYSCLPLGRLGAILPMRPYRAKSILTPSSRPFLRQYRTVRVSPTWNSHTITRLYSSRSKIFESATIEANKSTARPSPYSSPSSASEPKKSAHPATPTNLSSLHLSVSDNIWHATPKLKLAPHFHMPSLLVDAHNPPPGIPSDVHLTYAWFRGPRQESMQQGMVAHSRPDIKDPSVWTRVGSKSHYTPTNEDAMHLLKFVIYAEHKPGKPLHHGNVDKTTPKIFPEPAAPVSVGKYLYFVAPTQKSAPPRSMIERKYDFEIDLLPDNYSFTAMSWNVLARRYTDPQRLSNCPDYALQWGYRKEIIMEDLVNFSPDLISLQECEDDAYDTVYHPELKGEGYGALFEKRSGVLHDGCAMFYKKSKFRLISSQRVDFDDLEGLHKEQLKPLQYPSGTLLTRNVAILSLFEIKLKGTGTGSASASASAESQQQQQHHHHHQQQYHHLENVYGKRHVIFVNTHNFWDPQSPHIKLLQAHFLTEKLEAFKQKMAHNKDIPLDTPIIIMGDLNSTHKSSVYEYLTTGTAQSSSTDSNLIKDLLRTKSCQHNMIFKNAHQAHGEAVTNLTINFAGCLDYIFHTPNAVPLAELENPTTSESEELRQSILTDDYMGCIPNPAYPSDHLPLMVRFGLTINKTPSL